MTDPTDDNPSSRSETGIVLQNVADYLLALSDEEFEAWLATMAKAAFPEDMPWAR